MKIGIDISQTAYRGTGVANYIQKLVEHLTAIDTENEYILFFSSLRNTVHSTQFTVQNSKLQIKQFKFPPSLLDFLWNRLHIFPIEMFIGDVDMFISSDWTQPPARKAKMLTVLYDLIVYKYPEETHNKTSFTLKNFILKPNIVTAQKKRLTWVKKECDMILCISEATKKDAKEILGIEEKRLKVIYPGL